MRTSLLIALLMVAVPSGAEGIPRRTLADLQPMVGTWRGQSAGKPGVGMILRECQLTLFDRFIECRTTVTYAPQEKNKNSEIHVDVAIFSADSGSKKLRMRQFHGEGFINTYTETGPLTFDTDAIENIPAGWRAREAYSIEGNTWIETFSLAAAGKEYEVYSTASLQRVK